MSTPEAPQADTLPQSSNQILPGVAEDHYTSGSDPFPGAPRVTCSWQEKGVTSVTCARVCLEASACGSQTELPWHQEPSRAHRLGNERPYKGLLSVPFQRSARPLPGTRRSTACTSHVTHSPQATGLSLCSSLACLQGPQLEGIHEVSPCDSRKWLLTHQVQLAGRMIKL